MDDFEKLAGLVGASVEEAPGQGLPRTRAEALALGLSRYFTGKPCKHGHVAERSVSSRSCVECLRLRQATPEVKEYKRKHSARQEAKERKRQYNARPEIQERSRQLRATPESKECLRQRRATPEAKERRRQYLATPEVKERDRQRNARPEAKERKRRYAASPKNKEYMRQRNLARVGDAVLFAINQAELAAVRASAPADIVPQCPEPHRSQLQALIDRIRADPTAGKAVVGLLRTMRELRKAELAQQRADTETTAAESNT